MIVQMPFELPFEECNKCLSFDPIVTDRHYEVKDFHMTMQRTLTCKGHKFCKYLKEGVFGGTSDGHDKDSAENK